MLSGPNIRTYKGPPRQYTNTTDDPYLTPTERGGRRMSSDDVATDEVELPIKRTTGETLEDRLTANAYHNILPARYLRKNADGEPIENPEGCSTASRATSRSRRPSSKPRSRASRSPSRPTS